jgi:hypothetical protein
MPLVQVRVIEGVFTPGQKREMIHELTAVTRRVWLLCRPRIESGTQHAARSDLPEFLARALVYQAESGDRARIPLARTAAEGVTSPRLQARVQALPSD